MKNKKYFDGGSILSLLGGATNLIPKDNAAGGAASGAINGASSLAATGNPYLIGAGALIGGVAGGIQGNKQNMQNQINPYTDGISDRNNFLNIMADGGLIEYNTGGTHEQNPLGGIPQGVAPGGQTNTVEEGETRLKDFIFSDRLKVSKSMAKKFNLPDKFIGKSFADVSKTYNKELETRPNDPFSKKTVDLNMNNLMLANQEVANKKITNILADGGYLSPSQYSQQMQSRDFNPAIPMLEPTSLMNSQIPNTEPILNTQLAGMPTTFLGTARKNWPIQDQNLLNTPNMPDRTKGINPQMVSEGQQARGYNQNVGNYLRDIGRIVNQSQASGDMRSQDEITRDIVGDYDKQPLTTVPFPKTFGKGGQIQHKTNPFLEIRKNPYGRDSGYNEVQLDSIIQRMNQNPALLSSDERNFVQRFGDKIYGLYENNKPELLKALGDFDPIGSQVKYATGHSEGMVDGDGNPIYGGAAPIMGGTYKPNIKTISKAFAKESARAAKESKIYGNMLDELSKAKSGLNIPKELEGTVRFGSNKEISPGLIKNLKKGFGYGVGAAGAGAGLYGVGSLISEGTNNQSSQSFKNSTPNFDKKYDPFNVFSLANEQYELPISGISQPNINDIRNSNAATKFGSEKSSSVNNFDYQNISGPSTTLLGNTQAKNGNIGDFYDPSNPSLPFEGYKPASGSDWTRRGYMGNDFNTQNEWVKGQLSPENIRMWLDPESELNKGVPWRQNYINIIKQQQPKLYEDLLAGKVPADKLQELYTEEEVGPIQSLVDFPQKPLVSVKNPGITPPPNIPPPPSITTEKGKITIPPTTQTTKTPGTSMRVPNLWPEAGLLSAAPYMGLKPELANPTLMSTGYLKPQLADEMTMRSGIDSANRANIGALTGATGGNAAALRAGLLGAGNNYMDATSNAFMQGNQANNQARMAADQFNIQNQTGVAGNNMGVLNQFELENKQLINNINAKKADEFANTMSDYVGNASIRRAVRELEDARRKDIFAATGYMPAETGTFMQVTPDRTTANKTPGYSTSLPSAKLNFNPQAALHPSSFVPQQNPYDVAGANMLNEALEGSSLNGTNGFQQGFPGNFDPFEIQKTLSNKKIPTPEFANGGCIKIRRRGLK